MSKESSTSGLLVHEYKRVQTSTLIIGKVISNEELPKGLRDRVSYIEITRCKSQPHFLSMEYKITRFDEPDKQIFQEGDIVICDDVRIEKFVLVIKDGNIHFWEKESNV